MIDFGTIFSELWFLIPIFIVVAILKEFSKKSKKKTPYKNYRKNNYSKPKEENEITFSKIIDKLFPKEEVKAYSKVHEDISNHNKEYFNPNANKSFEEKLKDSESKYNSKYEKKKEDTRKENIYDGVDEDKEQNIKTKDYNYFTKLKDKEEEYKKRYETKEDAPKKKTTPKEKKQKGDEFEQKVGEHYEKQGYIVKFNGFDKGLEDGGIDLICINNDEILLVQCKNWKPDGTWKIRHTHVKAFHSDCIKYSEEMKLDRNKIRLKYAVPDKKVIHNSAVNIFRDKYYCCRYEVIN